MTYLRRPPLDFRGVPDTDFLGGVSSWPDSSSLESVYLGFLVGLRELAFLGDVGDDLRFLALLGFRGFPLCSSSASSSECSSMYLGVPFTELLLLGCGDFSSSPSLSFFFSFLDLDLGVLACSSSPSESESTYFCVFLEGLLLADFGVLSFGSSSKLSAFFPFLPWLLALDFLGCGVFFGAGSCKTIRN